MAKRSFFYIFHGEDDFRRATKVAETLNEMLPPENREFDMHRYSGREVDPLRLATAIGTPPMFSTTQVILLDEGENLSSSSLDALVGEIESFPSNREDSLRLLLVYTGGKKPPKKLKSLAGHVEEFKLMRWRDAQEWVSAYCRDTHGFSPPRNITEELFRLIGYNESGKLAQEIDKLVNLTNGGPIKMEDIRLATGALHTESAYDLYDALGHKNYPQASALAASLLTLPEYPGVRLVIGMSYHVLELLRIREMLDRGLSSNDVSKELKMPAWKSKKVIAQAKRWTHPELSGVMSKLLDADIGLKTGIPESRALETFLAEAIITPTKSLN